MNPHLDRLTILTVSGSQAGPLMEELKRAGFHFTVMHATEALVQEAEVCLLVGFPSEQLPKLLELTREKCRPYRRYISTQGFLAGEAAAPLMVEAELGGAQFCMMNVERFEQL